MFSLLLSLRGCLSTLLQQLYFVAGTIAVLDACGKCGGDNSTCTGCDGGIKSGAKYGKYP